MRILFLTTDLFSSGSGIARMARLTCKALGDSGEVERLDVISLVDDVETQPDACYLASQRSSYKAAGRWKVRFVAQVVSTLRHRYDLCLASHISLAPLLALCRASSPRTKLAAFAHGVEVWQRLGRLDHACAGRLDAFFAVSDFTRRRMIEANGFREDRARVIYNCLDPYLVREAHAGGPPANGQGPVLRHPNLLTVSRLGRHDHYKGHAQVIEALAKVRRRRPDVNYYVVGTGELVPELRGQAARLGLRDCVHFLGAVSDAELAAIYRQCDLFAMPSSCEGFGLVFAEVMNYGKAVIAGDRDASGEVVRDGETGLLVDPFSSEALAAAITRLLTNHELREQMGRRGAAVVREEFGFEKFRRTLVGYLSEAVAEKRDKAESARPATPQQKR